MIFSKIETFDKGTRLRICSKFNVPVIMLSTGYLALASETTQMKSIAVRLGSARGKKYILLVCLEKSTTQAQTA